MDCWFGAPITFIEQVCCGWRYEYANEDDEARRSLYEYITFLKWVDER